MSSLDRTLEKLMREVRDEIARSTPMPPWTVLVASRATPEEIEAAQRALAAIRAVTPTLRSITNRRKMTPRQRAARRIFREHDTVVRAFAERYTLRVLPEGHGETTYPWSGDLENDRPYHVEQRLREPSESSGLILWTVVQPGSLSEEQRELAEAHEAKRKRAVESGRLDDDEVAPVDPPPTATTAPPTDVAVSQPEPRPMTPDELRRKQARESFERLTDPDTRWRGVDHAPSADDEFKQARRQRRVDVRGLSFLLNNPRHNRRQI